MSVLRTLFISALALLSAAALSGCAGDPALNPELTETAALPETARLVVEGKRQLSEGNHGVAIEAFSKSIEIDAHNPDAWLGLAACYDELGRFDQADKAYGKVQQLVGATPRVLNNLGYSYLLRGNLDKARTTLAAAYQGDPGNPYILNNITILNEKLVALGHPPIVMN